MCYITEIYFIFFLVTWLNQEDMKILRAGLAQRFTCLTILDWGTVCFCFGNSHYYHFDLFKYHFWDDGTLSITITVQLFRVKRVDAHSDFETILLMGICELE